MSKIKTSWHSGRVGREVTVCRWGEVGTPVLFFPTAAGDAEEGERFLMIDTLAPLLEAGRIKLYSVDSVPGMVWLKESNDSVVGAQAQDAFDTFVTRELVPFIRRDCGNDDLEIVLAGASIGAFNALASICRHPDVFSHAICMSGTYDLSKFLEGPRTDAWQRSSPLDFLPTLPDNAHLAKLQERFVLISHGRGRWEEPAQSWRVAEALGKRRIPNRVDEWGEEWDHDWPTWRNMLPQYLEEILPRGGGDGDGDGIGAGVDARLQGEGG